MHRTIHSNALLKPVEPVKPAAPYLGGKSRLCKTIVPLINTISHEVYAEPFLGMGGIFFQRNQIPKTEVLNDINKEIAVFFRILQRHYVAFLDMLRFQLTTRVEFERLRRTDPETLTDLERAARFIYLQRIAFGGMSRGQFCVDLRGTARFDLTKLIPVLEDLHLRLAGVIIECLSYEDFIRRYDRSGTLFYLDPPYEGNEHDYGKGIFTRQDFEKIAALLSSLKGRFILSINDTPSIRKTFSAFNIQPVELTYKVDSRKSTKAQELIITDTK